MTSLALKSLWARKARALSTTVAVVIGVAFMAGSYVLTDTIFAAFDDIFSESLKGTSVVVTAKNPVEQENGEVPTISASLLPRVERAPGVRLAAGAIFTPGGFFDARTGDAIGSKFAPKFISSTMPDGLESLTYVDGHAPRGPTEASLDEAAAEESDLAVGDRIEIVGQSRARTLQAHRPHAPRQRLLRRRQHRPGDAPGRAGDHPQAGPLRPDLGRRLRAASRRPRSNGGSSPSMPGSVRVETAQENADRSSEEIRDNLGFFQTFLLVFAFIALFVGAFLIFNTFSITVAQRVTEFGMLRTLGASRRQILSTVVVEAVAIGLVGALVGIAGGFLVALMLKSLFVAFGIDLPTTGLVLETRTVIVSLLVGVRRHPRLVPGAGRPLDPGAADRRHPRCGAAADPPPPGALPGALGAARRSPASGSSCSGSSAAAAPEPRPAPSAAAPWRSSSPSPSSARAWCRPWRRSPAGRWSSFAASPAGSRARTRSATRPARR